MDEYQRMLLRNQDYYLDLLHIDIVTDVRVRFESNEKSKSTNGVFFEHEGLLFGLGVEFGEIYLIVSGKLLKYDDTVLETRLEEFSDHSSFTVIQHSRFICNVNYKPIKASGWVPNEDDECLDGFLWIHNVLQSSERRSILRHNSFNDK